MEITEGLIVDTPHIDRILRGEWSCRECAARVPPSAARRAHPRGLGTGGKVARSSWSTASDR